MSSGVLASFLRSTWSVPSEPMKVQPPMMSFWAWPMTIVTPLSYR